jgi:hypothetical protein
MTAPLSRQHAHDQRKRAEGHRRITCWFSPEEQERLSALVRRAGTSREEVVRYAVFKAWQAQEEQS